MADFHFYYKTIILNCFFCVFLLWHLLLILPRDKISHFVLEVDRQLPGCHCFCFAFLCGICLVWHFVSYVARSNLIYLEEGNWVVCIVFFYSLVFISSMLRNMGVVMLYTYIALLFFFLYLSSIHHLGIDQRPVFALTPEEVVIWEIITTVFT